ncbi:hypothetical protein EIP86_001410 [Pleurotus ostreatoroseus]|nr:hypothetical protein EIP86_001410 [Pleurotus ostreatoroseus]
MFHTIHNLRAFWFPCDEETPRFIGTITHRYAIRDGQDVPDLSPFVGKSTVTQRQLRVGRARFTLFHTVNGDLRDNQAMRSVGNDVACRGDVLVFRRGVHSHRLVNLRKGDQDLVVEAMKQLFPRDINDGGE